jgi:hypothetical protein
LPAQGGSGLSITNVPVRQITLFLPSLDGRPLASRPLIEAATERTSEASLAAWRVSALDLSAALAIEPLCACQDKRLLSPGIIVADDLAFWAVALRFTGALMARHAYLPDLVKAASGFAARWRPVLGGREVEEMARLAAAMPAACRAVPLNHAGTAPAVPAGVVLAEFVEDTLDALVRGTQPKPGSPPANAGRSRRRRRDPDVAVDQLWLAARCARRVRGSMAGRRSC